MEMLFCTSLVALVSAGDKPSASPRRLQIVNTKVCLALSTLSLQSRSRREGHLVKCHDR